MNRRLDLKRGLVCNLTDEWADFKIKCHDYQEDSGLIERERELKLARLEKMKESQTYGLSRYGIKDGTIAGIAIFGFAAIWFGIGLFELNTIFFYPPVLALIGLGLIIGDQVRKARVRKEIKRIENEDVIDLVEED